MRWLLILALLFLNGCGPSAPESAPKTALSQADIQALMPPQPAGEPLRFVNYGAAQYKAVTRDWVFKVVYPRYLSELGRIGLIKNGAPRWTQTSQCDYFADKFRVVAQEQHFEDTFHSFVPSESPAVGVVWYFKDGSPLTRHAIVMVVLSDKTPLFLEPQSPVARELVLTEAERATIYFRRF